MGTAVGVAMLALGLTGLFTMLSRAPGSPPVGGEPPVHGPKTQPPPDTAKAAFEKWPRGVAELPAERQGDAVGAELKRRNPGFDGKVNATVENGVVTGLQFLTDNVTDVSPVRALAGLKGLNCGGSDVGKGKLAGLSPLNGMTLTSLRLRCTEASDLSPLKGMKLNSLDCQQTGVSDLSALRGMPLTDLNCLGAQQVSDLSPLKGMPLTLLDLQGTKVSDLASLKGMPLTSLSCGNVSDLSPLKGMPLTMLHFLGAKSPDLLVLRDLPIKDLLFDFKPERDAAMLRSVKTLEMLNGQPAGQILRDAASDGSALVGTWRLDHDGFTDEIRISRTGAGMWDVKSSFLKESKEVGAWVGVQPHFADGELSFAMKWLVKPVDYWTDTSINLWTLNGRLQMYFTPLDGSRHFAVYARAAK